MQKKAVSTVFLVIVLALIILLLFLAFEANLFKIFGAAEIKGTCKTDVYANSLRLKGTAFSEKIRCPTEEIKIATTEQNEVNARVAKALYDCWDQFGQGKLELFQDSDGTYCAVCSIIDFEKKGMKIGHLTDYLLTENAPGRQESYMDYLAGYATPALKEYYDNPGIFNQMDTRLSEELDTGQLYSVIFVYAKGVDAITELKASLGEGTAVVGAGVAGAGIVTTGLIVLGVSPIGWIPAGVVGLGAIVAGTVTYFSPRDIEYASFVFLQPHAPETFKKLNCDWYPATQAGS
jgi:hypothetical protein